MPTIPTAVAKIDARNALLWLALVSYESGESMAVGPKSVVAATAKTNSKDTLHCRSSAGVSSDTLLRAQPGSEP